MEKEEDRIKKRLKMAYLIDIYSALLTEKQRGILNSFYGDDLSFTEIADENAITRQAAFDLVRRSENVLLSYDEKLGLYEKYLKNTAVIHQIIACAENGECERIIDLAIRLKEDL